MIEKWKDISGYEGYYQVSNFGEVRTVGHKYQRKGFHKIKLHNNRNGYWLADLHKNNLYKSKAIHRLVAEAFIPNPNNFPEVNHIDGNKANNCVDNLEWVSKSQNKWHACNILGQRTNRIKDFSTGNVFPSQKSAALYYGVSESLIRSIVKKQIFSNRKKRQEITNHRIEIISEREYIDTLNKSKLVDAVNNQQIQLNNHECRLLDLHSRISALDDPTYHEAEPKNRMIGCTTFDKVEGKMNPEIDPYAEQKKWIGKLCKFWDYDDEEKWFSKLEYIDKNSSHTYGASGDWWYKHCEPVKPDDDIIYKKD